MKKKWIAVPALAVLAYPAVMWWAGHQVEMQLAEQYSRIAEVPFVKVVKRDFRRGFAQSSETVTLELFGELFRKLQEASPRAGAQTFPPLLLTVHSRIQHGPIAGGALAGAVIDSELTLEGEAGHAAAQAFGDKKPLTVHTVVGFGGGGRSSITSPAFKVAIPARDGAKLDITWDGLSAQVDFDAGVRRYSLRGDAPKLELDDGRGKRATMAGLRMEAAQQRVFDDEPMLYSGTQRFSVARLDIADAAMKGDAVSLQQLTYDIDMPVAGEFLDVGAKMAAQTVVVGARSFGPVRYEVSVNHLHVRTLAKLYKAMMRLYADPATLVTAGDPAKLFAPLSEPAKALLAHDPELRIDRISVTTPQGEARLAAHLRLKGATPDDLGNVFMLIGKLDIGAEIVLPEALLAEFREAPAQLESLVSAGYITRAGGMIKAKAAFANGDLTVNGKPIDPMALAGVGRMERRADAEEVEDEEDDTAPPARK